MHDEPNGNAALAELRKRLDNGLAHMRLDKTALAGRAGLGRTTVSEAFRAGGPVPSGGTIQALATALRLPADELLELRRAATGASAVEAPGPGRPVGECEPHDLEVHPAGYGASAPVSTGVRVLPGYVRRAHDGVLATAVREAAAGRSGIVILVGTSSTGKTRACWEAVQPLAEHGWRLWHPFDPTRAEEALENLHRVGPRTVVWLNEAQHYLGHPRAGERIAAAVHSLLTGTGRGPVLVLGTLWPEYAARYTALPAPGRDDPHSRVRELLAGRILTVPDAFDAPALATAETLAQEGDCLLAEALERGRADGRVTQDLAGAPELLNRYRHATPPALALLEAAMDARRLGVGPHIPQSFLTDAAADYLTDTERDHRTDDWAEQAFAHLAEPVHGKQAPLRRADPRPQRHPPGPPSLAEKTPAQPAGPVFRLADYLEQHGRTTRQYLCPPASFWHAAHTHIADGDDLNNLAEAAEHRHRLQWAHHLRQRAAEQGNIDALLRLAETREPAWDREGAGKLTRRAADQATTDMLLRLSGARERAGDREGAETLAHEAADHGIAFALFRLARLRDRKAAKMLAREAAVRCTTFVLARVAGMRERAGDQEGAERLAREAADRGDTHALVDLAWGREWAGDREAAERLAYEAADHGHPLASALLVEMREEAGDQEDAERLAREVADHGGPYALALLARMRGEAGDQEDAERLAREAADRGNI
ncbi:hypothetical protein ACF08W_31315, partial [Streptomyces sp. NPDC015144]|uniref:hypothetical protein n=1 Tax=Streptomyces sp. NPDC015144 TaxID=3364944 RepID=UPI0036FB15B5